MTGHMSKFALLCQAARLLGQVLSHLSGTDDQDDSWIQLDRTLQSMLAAALDIDCPDYDQITFIYRSVMLCVIPGFVLMQGSALIALHTPFLSAQEIQQSDSHRRKLAKKGLQQITERINANLIERRCFLGRNTEDMSPWGMFFAYRVCVAHLHSTEKPTDAVQLVISLREAFQAISERWGAARVYLQLLEAHDANM